MYLLNKIDFDSYLKDNDDGKFNDIRRSLIDDFEDFYSVRIENIKNILNGFVNFFVTINSSLSGYW